jgi:hypothetical protein
VGSAHLFLSCVRFALLFGARGGLAHLLEADPGPVPTAVEKKFKNSQLFSGSPLATEIISVILAPRSRE